ncbi:hypothetical protein TNCV_3853541 [Trichonephila clavipes]|nr:hypothetical protein TNCV_3853541 [Trichonephila clavipes]
MDNFIIYHSDPRTENMDKWWQQIFQDDHGENICGRVNDNIYDFRSLLLTDLLEKNHHTTTNDIYCTLLKKLCDPLIKK